MREPAHQGDDAALAQGLQHTYKAAEGFCTCLVFRAVRHLARYHRRTKGPLRAVVGGLHMFGVPKEAQQVAPILMSADLIEQTLVVGIGEASVPKVKSEEVLKGLAPRFIVGSLARMVILPQL